MNRASWFAARCFLFVLVAGFVPACGAILGFDDFTGPGALTVDSGDESASSADAGKETLTDSSTEAKSVDAPLDRADVEDVSIDQQQIADAKTDQKQNVDATSDATTLADGGPSVLLALNVSLGTLTPPFSASTFNYSVTVHDSFAALPFTVTAYVPQGSALSVGNAVAFSGVASAPLPIPVGKPNVIDVMVANPYHTTQHYSILVTNVPLYNFVKASNTRANASFSNVAFDGDTIVVGSPGESSNARGINGDQNDTSAPSSGAVYVFKRSGTLWAQEAYIKASNTRAGALFGGSVAISGDTIAVGSSQESSAASGIAADQTSVTANGAGAVYIFKRVGTVWAQEAYVKASNTQAGAQFGLSVALSNNTLAVGASTESSSASGIDGDQTDTSAPAAGAAYVFTRTGSSWSQQAYVKASNARPSSLFAESVALSGDTLAVGAPGESSGALGIGGDQSNTTAPSSGAVYVFVRTGTNWLQTVYMKASGPSTSFGTAVALDVNTLAAGSSAGAAYVFLRTGSAWQQQAIISPSNARPGNTQFGHSIAVAGDVLAIGDTSEPSAAIGVNGDQTDTSLTNQGAVYAYRRTGSVWTQQAYVKTTAPTVSNPSGDNFGASVAIFGDTLAIGAPSDRSAAKGIDTASQSGVTALLAGAVYVLR